MLPSIFAYLVFSLVVLGLSLDAVNILLAREGVRRVSMRNAKTASNELLMPKRKRRRLEHDIVAEEGGFILYRAGN